VAMSPNRSIEWYFTKKLSFSWAVLWASNMPKMLLAAGAPNPTGGAHDAPLDHLLRADVMGGKGPCRSPKPWTKKNKIQLLRYAYRRAGSRCH